MKPITQAYVIAILSKAILILIVVFQADDYDISKGVYNFIVLIGTFALSLSTAIEIYKKNYIMAFLAIVLLVIFQPVWPIFKRGIEDGDVSISKDLLAMATTAVLLWVVYDIVMLIITIVRNRKKLD